MLGVAGLAKYSNGLTGGGRDDDMSQVQLTSTAVGIDIMARIVHYHVVSLEPGGCVYALETNSSSLETMSMGAFSELRNG